MIGAENPGLGFALKCAHCGETALHHDEVVVFERREDAVQGIRAMVSGSDRQDGSDTPRLLPLVSVDSSMFGNPSPRRQGVRIGLWCESCGGRSSLAITQHKGVTYLECVRASS